MRENQLEINKKISASLKGRKQKTGIKHPNYKLSDEARQKRAIRADSYYKAYIQRWKEGLETGLLKGKTAILHRFIRRYLFEKYSSKCSKCNWSIENKFSHTIPLEVNHIDGHYENCEEKNLELLCPNCHSLTSNFRNLNKGNGREYRMQV